MTTLRPLNTPGSTLSCIADRLGLVFSPVTCKISSSIPFSRSFIVVLVASAVVNYMLAFVESFCYYVQKAHAVRPFTPSPCSSICLPIDNTIYAMQDTGACPGTFSSSAIDQREPAHNSCVQRHRSFSRTNSQISPIFACFLKPQPCS